MATFNKDERNAINAAFDAIEYLCGSTNWSDPATLREALKLERRETQDTTIAKAMICKAWLEGADHPHKPASAFHWVRPGYLKAQLLGVGHAVQRADSAYTGPMVSKARDLCPAAIEAIDAQTARNICAS
ncbi:hypothetical protein [Caenibius sp. WL]|uniref:hypothetical protein n=1 Tax=Caenibius sp. WL TaxID=2872646 RepID=UPI001C9996D8|nr:hypothetical protein [Caenibius sp. WL]QZP06769.1 hypothetical protein K5X80_08515 [Caenibius sp. WL]